MGWFYWARYSSLENEARADVEAIASGNVERLLVVLTPEERAAGINAGQLRSIYDLALKEHLKKITSKGAILSEITDPSRSSAAAKQLVRLANGRTGELVFQVYQTEDGPKNSVAFNLLSLGWQIEYQAKPGYIPHNLDSIRATLAGIQEDRSKLETAGIKGFYLGPSRGFVTWDQCQSLAQGNLARMSGKPGGQLAVDETGGGARS